MKLFLPTENESEVDYSSLLSNNELSCKKLINSVYFFYKKNIPFTHLQLPTFVV
jgi:hypothetical protein